MRNLLSHFAEDTGETLLAVHPGRLSMEARDGAASPGAGIAVIPLVGSLTNRGLTFYGRTISPGMDAFRAAVGRAAADPGVGAIVLDVNTPGGTYAGTPETFEAVRRAAEVKPVISVVDSLAASAGLFVIAPSTEIAVTPSGEMGSIGVLSIHLDWSRSLEQDGVTPTIIRSRAGKADVNPFEPLTDEARAALQQSVDEADDEFLKAIAKGRGMSVGDVRKLADEAGLARTVSAKRAVQLGIADRVATMSEVLSGLIKSKAPARRRSALAFE